MSLFQRLRRGRAAPNEQDLAAQAGKDWLALRLSSGSTVPPGCTAVIYSESGQARRLPDFRTGGAAQRLSCGEKESAWCFHPGPYRVDLAPFALAPEMGLRVQFVVDAPDPRVGQQRFDLFLCSEGGERQVLGVQDFSAMAEHALRLALAQGRLELPPCTSPEEWTAFRAGLNELLYTRFGITLEDCIPVDLGDTVDFAAILRQRAGAADAIPPAVAPAGEAPSAPTASSAASASFAPSAPFAPSAATAAFAPPAPSADTEQAAHAAAQAGPCAPSPAAPASAPPAAEIPLPGVPPGLPGAAAGIGAGGASEDGAALRRLFLELPALSNGLRMLDLPQGQGFFLVHQGLLQRLALLALDVNTMPALALAAPGQPLSPARQRRRSGHSVQAVAALDEAWGLLARLKLAAAAGLPALLDDADRILANMELSLERRRAAQEAQQAPGAATVYELPRIEPSL